MKKLLLIGGALLALLFTVEGVFYFQSNDSNPTIVDPKEIPALLRALPDYAVFSFGEVCFLGDKLYAATNMGLLEVKDGSAQHLYRWSKRDSVVSGAWCEARRNYLWVQPRDLRLFRYDGSQWSDVAFPPPASYYSRGDVLKGFQILTNENGVWLLGGDQVSRRDETSQSWIAEKSPPSSYEDKLVRVMASPKGLLFVMRHEGLDFLVHGDDFKSDTVHHSDKSFTAIPNQTGKPFFADGAVYASGSGFICSRSGDVLRVTDTAIVRIEIPGQCEVMASDSQGKLVVSFRGKGIFEYSGSWKQLLPCPYPPDEEKHFIWLAVDNGRVALATSAMPEIVPTENPSPTAAPKWKDVGTTALWFSHGLEWKRIDFTK